MTASRRIDRPEPGYWLIRLVKGGPLVPACIVRELPTDPWFPDNEMDRGCPRLVAYIGGEPAPLDRVWHTRGEDITEDEYWDRLAQRRVESAEMPSARAINRLTAPIPF